MTDLCRDCSSAQRCPSRRKDTPTYIIADQPGRREGTVGFRRVSVFTYRARPPVPILRAAREARVPQNYTPHLWPRVALLKRTVIVPHQLAIRFRYDRLLRVRVNRRSAVEMESRV